MNNESTKVVRFHKTGDASVLKLEDMPTAEPQAGEVRIRVEAIGLNRAEVMFREGQYLESPVFPARLGYEAAGVVTAIGAEVRGIEPGDRVSTIPAFSMGKYGVYGESAIVPAAAVARYPDNMSAIEGASIWMQYMTAYGALIDIAQLKRGQTVLITAASSSVGVAAMQTAKVIGAQTIATTRTPEKEAFLKGMGADHVIVTDTDDLVGRMLEFTDGKGADLVFDPIGGPLLKQLAQASREGAMIIEYGALSSLETPFPLFLALAKALTFRGYTLFEITQNAQRLSRAKEFIYDGLKAGHLKPVIDKAFSLSKIKQAHEYMESNQQCGKVVVTV